MVDVVSLFSTPLTVRSADTDVEATAKKKRKPTKPQPAVPLDHTPMPSNQPIKAHYAPMQQQASAQQAVMRQQAAMQQQAGVQQAANQPVVQQPGGNPERHPVQQATSQPPPQPVQPAHYAVQEAAVPKAGPATQAEACCCAMSLLVFSPGEWCVAARRCDARGVTLVEHWLTGTEDPGGTRGGPWGEYCDAISVYIWR